MKKILSVLIAAMMTVSVLAISSTAMAAPSPSGDVVVDVNPSLYVNGAPNDTDVSYTPAKNDPTTITFKYTGEGTIKGWETNLEDLGYVEGTDFTLTENADGSLTVKFINADALKDFNEGTVIIDAIVDIKTDDVKTDDNKAEKNDSNKSPSTGIATATIAGSIAVAGAGFAVLSATKKRDAE